MPHLRLLLKLKTHGIGDGIIDWIEQWLTDRRQRVAVDWKSILSGVQRGSVLGPLLFLIYIYIYIYQSLLTVRIKILKLYLIKYISAEL